MDFCGCIFSHPYKTLHGFEPLGAVSSLLFNYEIALEII
jgi:hypothetical protein